MVEERRRKRRSKEEEVDEENGDGFLFRARSRLFRVSNSLSLSLLTSSLPLTRCCTWGGCPSSSRRPGGIPGAVSLFLGGGERREEFQVSRQFPRTRRQGSLSSSLAFEPFPYTEAGYLTLGTSSDDASMPITGNQVGKRAVTVRQCGDKRATLNADERRRRRQNAKRRHRFNHFGLPPTQAPTPLRVPSTYRLRAARGRRAHGAAGKGALHLQGEGAGRGRERTSFFFV